LLSNKLIIRIITYYVNKDNILDTTVLAIKEIYGAYTRENLALVVIVVIKD
jgi:hypothetical protein